MATYRERLAETQKLLMADSVTSLEAYVHMYYFLRFEIAIAKRNQAARRANKYAQKIHTNLEVFALRSEMSKL